MLFLGAHSGTSATDSELKAHFECATRCAGMTDADREKVAEMWRSVGCEQGGPGMHPVCASSLEQLCVGACGGGQQDMPSWLPGTFGKASPGVKKEQWLEFEAASKAHRSCSAECARQGVTVAADAPDAAQRALQTLQRCGVVQLRGAYASDQLDKFQKAFEKLRAKPDAYKKLLDQKQLHDGRYQVYLPYTAPFNTRQAIGVSDLVLEVLGSYFQAGGHGFGIDHVSVLTSASESGNQSLHPDVPYFKGLTVSVHTALRDVSMDMGPTFFCPCTGEALVREEWPSSAAIKMTILKRRDCLASSLAPPMTSRGTVTIYDGAMFHKGLENDSGKDRPVLKLEVGATDFPERRNYIQLASKAAKKQMLRFRSALGPPRMGEKLASTEL